MEAEANCAHVGVRGAVRVGPDDDDDPIANVTIRVTGEDDYTGPFFGTSGADGKYAIVIGEYGHVDEDIEFRAEVFGPGVDTSDEPEWETTEDCHSDDAVQIMNIDWARDDDDE